MGEVGTSYFSVNFFSKKVQALEKSKYGDYKDSSWRHQYEIIGFSVQHQVANIDWSMRCAIDIIYDSEILTAQYHNWISRALIYDE